MSRLIQTSLNSLAQVSASKIYAPASSSRTFFFKSRRDIKVPEDLDHSTGEERAVRLAIARGIQDPFDVQEQIRGPGTKGK